MGRNKRWPTFSSKVRQRLGYSCVRVRPLHQAAWTMYTHLHGRKNRYAHLTGSPIQSDLIVTDFEMALRAAVETEFPAAEVRSGHMETSSTATSLWAWCSRGSWRPAGKFPANDKENDGPRLPACHRCQDKLSNHSPRIRKSCTGQCGWSGQCSAILPKSVFGWLPPTHLERLPTKYGHTVEQSRGR